MAATFRAGGLASNIDTNSIIDSLVNLQRQPIEKLKTAQRAVDVKVSALGQLGTRLKAFETAVKDLAKQGARAFKIAEQPASASVTVDASAQPGRYLVQVTALATAAKQRATPFGATDTVTGGTLHIATDGEGLDVTIPDGASLETVAAAIRASGAPVSTTVVNDGVNRHLSVTRNATGFEIGSAASTALEITETTTGTAGKPLGFTSVATATNAHVAIDGLDIERRSNDVKDALPGVVISAKQVAAAPESLVIDDDNTTTRAALQKVVDAYNGVVSFVQGELDLDADTDRQKTLAGEPAMRMLQTRMQGILVREIAGGANALRTLADVGVRSARDGSLTIDDATFNAAMARDPASIDRLFDGGLADFSASVVAAFANTTDGVFTLRSKGLTGEKKRMDDEIARLEARAERYKDLLVARFTAMEKTVSSLKAIGNFLTAQDKKQDS